MLMYMTQQKVLTLQVMYSTIGSNKKRYSVTANCVNPHPSEIKFGQLLLIFFVKYFIILHKN